MASVIDSDTDFDSDIPPTPENSPTISFNQSKTAKYVLSQETVTFETTKSDYHNFEVKRNEIQATVHRPDLIDVCHMPYAYYELEDILKFTVNLEPVNPNIKLIGIYNEVSYREHYLTELDFNKSKTRILLQCNHHTNYPKNGETIEAYGTIVFKKNNTSPILFLSFWNTLKVDVVKYLECVKLQQQFIPICHTGFVAKGNIEQSLAQRMERLLDNSFEDISLERGPLN